MQKVCVDKLRINGSSTTVSKYWVVYRLDWIGCKYGHESVYLVLSLPYDFLPTS